jgi:hypothetical protein
MAGAVPRSDAKPVTPFSSAQQDLYRAYSHCYATEANQRRIAFVVDVVFTTAAATIAILTVTDLAESLTDYMVTWMPPAALLWLLLRESNLIGDDIERRRTAVTIQEQFDLTFWKLNHWQDEWNRILCGDPVRPREIKELALAYDGPGFTDDYWVDTSGIDPEAAALLRIRQSAAWGAKGHRRYARLNRVAAWTGLTAVLTFAFVTDLGTRETAGVLITVAPLLVGRLQSSRSHLALAERRAVLEDHIAELLSGSASLAGRDVRLAQDELFRMRLENRRIPSWLYHHYVQRDRDAIDATLAEEAQRLRTH